MKIHVRCTEINVTPSDPSGFYLTAEVADWRELWRAVVMELDEPMLRKIFGDEQFDDVRKVREVINRALEAAGFDPQRSSDRAV